MLGAQDKLMLDWFDEHVPAIRRKLVGLALTADPTQPRVQDACKTMLEALEKLEDELADALPPIEEVERERRRRNEDKRLAEQADIDDSDARREL